MKAILELFKKKEVKREVLPKVRKKRIKIYRKVRKRVEKLLVSQLMTKDVIGVDRSSTLEQVADLFIAKNISGAPVISGGKLIGEISKTDLLKIVGAEDLKAIDAEGMEKLAKMRVEQVMKKPICIQESATIAQVRKKMEKFKIRRLIVLDEKKELVGIITATDLARGISKEKIRERVSTAVDEMLALLEEKGEMRIDELSKRFKVSPELVEEWAKILEENELIELEYPAFGKAILKWKKTKVI